MQKMIIDPVVNKVNIDSLVRGEPYDYEKEGKEKPIYRSIR